jgi:hypothetical protein
MDAGVVSGAPHPVSTPRGGDGIFHGYRADTGIVPTTLRVTVARAICFVIAPRRCSGIAVVALPRI